MDIAAKFRRVNCYRLPLLGTKSIVQEIAQTALCLLINLGGREHQTGTIQLTDMLWADCPQAEIRLGARDLIGLIHPQCLSNGALLPASQKSTGLLAVRIRKAESILIQAIAAGKARQPPVDEGGLLAGRQHIHRFQRAAEYSVNFRKLRLDTLHSTAGQGNPQRPQGHTLLVREHTGRAGIGRQTSLLRTQQNQVLLAVAAHGGYRTQLHHVQHRWDGAYIILAQQQTQQTHKVLRLPMGLPQHIIHLLQGGHENLPQLVEYLRFPIAASFIQLLCHCFQSLLHTNPFQKLVQRLHLTVEGGGIAKPLAQLLQWFHEPSALPVQKLQAAFCLLRPVIAQSVRVIFPVG